MLQGFQLLSGLRINFEKINLYGIGQNEESVEEWAEILGCEVGKNSFVYLGMEVLQSPSSIIF